MKKITTILSLLFILIACNNEKINEKHRLYLEELGWSIQSFDTKKTIELSKDSLVFYNTDQYSFLENYVGKELVVMTYELHEKDIEGDNIQAILYEHNGEIIGSVGKIKNATPGILNLEDDDRITDE